MRGGVKSAFVFQVFFFFLLCAHLHQANETFRNMIVNKFARVYNRIQIHIIIIIKRTCTRELRCLFPKGHIYSGENFSVDVKNAFL